MEIVELRVHGVHGTSPGTMLGLSDGEVGQVAGDRLTGIYRPKTGVTLPLRELEDTAVSVEAYSWGALTSGIQGFLGWIRRALWLILLPFALANLAYWARIELARPTRQARWGARAVRVSGLLLTVFMVLTPCVIAVDLIGWQCYRRGVPGCPRIPEHLDVLASWTATQRIGVMTVVPMLVILVLWLLSKQTLSRYENVGDPLEGSARSDIDHVLTHPKLWNGLERTQRLQRLHIVGAIATVIGFTGAHVLYSASGSTPLVWVTTSLAAALGLLALFLVLVSHTDDLENLPPGPGRAEQRAVKIGDRVRGWDDAYYRRLCLLALAVYIAHVAVLWFSDRELDERLDFFGHNLWFIGVFVLLTVLHLSVFAGGRMSSRWAIGAVIAPVCVGAVVATILFANDRFHGWMLGSGVVVVLIFWAGLSLWHYGVSAKRNKHMAWNGAGASVLLAAATWIALLFTTSAVVAAANYVNGTDNGVSGLVSTIEGGKGGGAEAATPFDVDQLRSPTYVASGDVRVIDAYVSQASGTLVVRSGLIEVDGLSLEVPKEEQQFTEGIGEARVTKDSTLTIEGTTVTLVDACLGDGSTKCTGEDANYHASGVIQVPAKKLLIEPGSGAVLLDPAMEPAYPLVVPQVLIWTPIAQLVWLLAVAIALVVAVLRFTRKAGPEIGRSFAADPDIPQRDRKVCLKARRSAALAHRAETLLDVAGAVTAPIALVTIVLSMSGEPPWALPHAEWTRNIATLSMYLVVGMSALLVMLGSQIRRSESARKAVGVIWDLTTFWPRAAHPLAPPCYAERVIPELGTRTRWALNRGEGNLVILSGHSQGSLIVASMASRLTMRELQRVRIITYGSQIRGLYGRVFPRVFGAEAIGYTVTTDRARLDDAFPDAPRTTPAPGPPPEPAHPADDSLRGRLSRVGGAWVNLFRRSDYLGFRVFSDVDSPVDRPVPEVPVETMGDPGPAVMTHSGYQHSMAYRTHVALWTGEAVVPDPPGTKDQPVLPPV
ncbi:MAG TPA: hypothetical protein VLI04_09795 [Nocardioidaceae bacterium]|nr:hypothetical protein [Nocardioidaceae bacterium]